VAKSRHGKISVPQKMSAPGAYHTRGWAEYFIIVKERLVFVSALFTPHEIFFYQG
jgi:hypothetical protein